MREREREEARERKRFIGMAPTYLRELCCPVTTVVGHRVLPSSSSGRLLVPHVNTLTAFSVVASSVWSELPVEILLLPRSNTPLFYKLLKICFLSHWGMVAHW